MFISYHWLKKFVNLKQTPKELADKITLNLVEVEAVKVKGEDTILEIENKGITNRPDCFSELGFAREAAAYFNLKINDPLERLTKIKFVPFKNIPFNVEVLEPSFCFRYSSIVLTDIEVKPSPKWLKAGLENCGLRSINNVVDITNYVMLELGQPLHAFDYHKLEGGKIIVRIAKNKEKITTLDGEIRELNNDILVIADAKDPIAIAGVIGGTKSEIKPNTNTIVLESANFERFNNRKTEKFLKLRTDASTRFEKGLDINLTLPALNRAVSLLQKLTKAKVASKIIDLQFRKVKPWQIRTSSKWINKFLGIKLSTLEMIKILKRLQLKAVLTNNQLNITIPTYRSDLKMPADIAEEIARIYGYDNIPISPICGPIIPPKPNQSIELTKKVKLFLQSSGFSEILSVPFISKNALEDFNFNPKNSLKLMNPLNIEQEYLRQSLVPQLLLTAKNNLRFFNYLKLFEIDRIFIPEGQNQPKEIIKLAALIINKNSYLFLKGMLENLFSTLGIKARFMPFLDNSSFWQQNKTAAIYTDKNENLGAIGKINKTILNKINLAKDLSILEINFSKIITLTNLLKIYQPISNYPPIIEDLTFVINGNIYVNKLIQLIKSVSPIIKIVDILGSYNNNLTFRITYQHQNKNLSSQEVSQIREKIINEVGVKNWGKLKGKGKD